jgi:uncharacterized RDD family membrane protein YckC
MTVQPPLPPMMPPPAPQYGAPPPSGLRYAGFWIRLLAYIIDTVIVDGITYGLLVATKPISCITSDGTTCIPGTTTISAVFYVLLLIPVVYFIGLWAVGGTIGQRVLGLRVVSAATGANLGVARSLLRFVGYLISTAALFIGLIWAGFDARKQGWHDKIADSFVLRTR